MQYSPPIPRIPTRISSNTLTPNPRPNRSSTFIQAHPIRRATSTPTPIPSSISIMHTPMHTPMHAPTPTHAHRRIRPSMPSTHRRSITPSTAVPIILPSTVVVAAVVVVSTATAQRRRRQLYSHIMNTFPSHTHTTARPLTIPTPTRLRLIMPTTMLLLMMILHRRPRRIRTTPAHSRRGTGTPRISRIRRRRHR